MKSEAKRRFRATAVRLDESIGIGIEEYSGKGDAFEITGIHSLYYPQRLTNRDASINVIQYVQTLLDEGDYAGINAVDIYAKHQWTTDYSPRITMQRVRYKRSFDDVQLLARDATERRSSISEVFETEEG